jgi:hypothetical protein
MHIHVTFFHRRIELHWSNKNVHSGAFYIMTAIKMYLIVEGGGWREALQSTHESRVVWIVQHAGGEVCLSVGVWRSIHWIGMARTNSQ